MSSTPADYIAEKAPPAPVDSLHDPEVLDLVRDLQNRPGRPLLLITGPSGVGKSTFVEQGLRKRIARLNKGFRSTHIQVRIDDSSASLVNQCIREIWRHHPDLNRHIVTRANVARQQRKSLLELAETDPVRAGKQLFAILRGVEKNQTGSLRDIRMMLHIGGMERLYENCVSAGGDPFVPVFGPTADPFGFIRELLGSNSIQMVLSYRDWITGSINQALQRSEIAPSGIFQYEVDWPTETRITSVIAKTILESKAGSDGKQASEIAASLVRQFSKASPACIQHLQGMLATAGSEDKPVAGYLSSTAEDYYQSLDDDVRGGMARIVHRFSKSGTLPAREVSNDPHLWNAANGMANGGILCLSGSSLDNAEFSLVSQDIFASWDRAARWTEEGRAPAHNIQQADQFENHALSWASTGRTGDLLLHVDTSIDQARRLLSAHDEKPILSPLAHDFLQASVAAAGSKIGARLAILKSFALTAGAAVAAVLVITAFIHLSNSTEPEATPVAAPSAPALASAPELATVSPATENEATALSQETPLEPVEAAVPEEQLSEPILPPEGLFDDSSLESILAKVETHLAEQNLMESLAAIRFFHDRALSRDVDRPKSSQLHRLTVALGKIALLQGDQKGAEFGWQLGLGGSKRSNVSIPAELKLLMARAEANAGRIDDAAAILFGTGKRLSLSTAVKPILDFEFSSIDPDSLPQLDTAVVASLPVSKKAKAALLGN